MRGAVVTIGCAALLACAPNAPSATATPAPPAPGFVLQAYPTAAQFGEDRWVLSGGGRDAYYVHRDGDAWELEPHESTYGKYGTWMRSTDALSYRGKRVRITIQARTHGAEQRVDVWSRVQAANSPSDGQGLIGEWKKLPADSN